jgi:hypothetical protein
MEAVGVGIVICGVDAELPCFVFAFFKDLDGGERQKTNQTIKQTSLSSSID